MRKDARSIEARENLESIINYYSSNRVSDSDVDLNSIEDLEQMGALLFYGFEEIMFSNN